MKIKHKIAAILGAVIVVCGVYTAAHNEPELVEYRAVAKQGDTVWGLCSKVASPKDNIQEVVWRAKELSGIKDSTKLQPGQTVIIRVKPIAD